MINDFKLKFTNWNRNSNNCPLSYLHYLLTNTSNTPTSNHDHRSQDINNTTYKILSFSPYNSIESVSAFYNQHPSKYSCKARYIIVFIIWLLVVLTKERSKQCKRRLITIISNTPFAITLVEKHHIFSTAINRCRLVLINSLFSTRNFTFNNIICSYRLLSLILHPTMVTHCMIW